MPEDTIIRSGAEHEVSLGEGRKVAQRPHTDRFTHPNADAFQAHRIPVVEASEALRDPHLSGGAHAALKNQVLGPTLPYRHDSLPPYELPREQVKRMTEIRKTQARLRKQLGEDER